MHSWAVHVSSRRKKRLCVWGGGRVTGCEPKVGGLTFLPCAVSSRLAGILHIRGGSHRFGKPDVGGKDLSALWSFSSRWKDFCPWRGRLFTSPRWGVQGAARSLPMPTPQLRRAHSLHMLCWSRGPVPVTWWVGVQMVAQQLTQHC